MTTPQAHSDDPSLLCPECGYSLVALEPGRPCPECGVMRDERVLVLWGQAQTDTTQRRLYRYLGVIPYIAIIFLAMHVVRRFGSIGSLLVAGVVVGSMIAWRCMVKGATALARRAAGRADVSQRAAASVKCAGESGDGGGEQELGATVFSAGRR